ncbi:MAG: MFS transporter, partial [Dehalococcoidia bacterium]
FLIGTIFTFNMPGRHSFLSELVSPEHLTNAVALTSATMNLNRVAAPALAGVLVGLIGVEGVYFIVVGCYAFVVITLLLIPVRSRLQVNHDKSLLRDLKDGLSYMRGNSEVSSLIVLAFVPIVFAMYYQLLLPVFAKDVLDVDSSGLGLLMGSIGVGALMGTLGIASLADFQRKGVLMLGLLITFGIALSLFALSEIFYLSMAALLLVGVGSQGYMALNNTLILTHTEPEMRGRVMSMYSMTWGLTPLSMLPAGAIADSVGAPSTVHIGAVLLLVSTALMALLRPQLRRLK